MNFLNIISGKAFAESVFVTGNKATAVGLNISDTGLLVSTAIKALIGAAGLLFFVMLVWGGIQFVTSGGDKAQATAAKDRITHALIGIVIVAAAFAIATLLQNVLGIGVTNFTIQQAY
ncbi:MAG: hypothetical protein NT141_02060 [candidate division WWE3 bacterium]|nr:hypothetical protein [candidate division WWE3 bacterium]